MTVRCFLGYLQSTEHRWGSDNSRAKRPVGQVTVQRYYTGQKVFFNWAVAEGYIAGSPMLTLKKPKTPALVTGNDLESNLCAELPALCFLSLIQSFA